MPQIPFFPEGNAIRIVITDHEDILPLHPDFIFWKDLGDPYFDNCHYAQPRDRAQPLTIQFYSEYTTNNKVEIFNAADVSQGAATDALLLRDFSAQNEPSIYEHRLDLSALPYGEYYLVFTGAEAAATYEAKSEPILLKEDLAGYVQLHYFGYDVAQNIDYSTVIEHRLWVPGKFSKSRIETGSSQHLEGDKGANHKISHRSNKMFILDAFHVPGYVIEKVNLALALDEVNINTMRVQYVEDIEPEYEDDYGLVSASGKVRQFVYNYLNRHALPGRIFKPNPSDLAAVALNCSSIRLTWTDTNVDEDSYEIQISTVGGGLGFTDVATAAADKVTIDLPDLDSLTQYWVRVRSIRDGVASDWSNEATATTTEAFQNCLRFDGTNDYVKLNSSPASSGLSWCMSIWLRPHNVGAATGRQCLISEPGNKLVYYVTINNNNEVIVRFNGSIRTYTLPEALVNDTWYNLVVKRQGSSGLCSVHLNGVQSPSGLQNVNTVNTRPRVFGQDGTSGTGPDDHFEGDLDQFVFWHNVNVGLTGPDPVQLYNEGSQCIVDPADIWDDPSTPLIILKFNETSGNSTADSSGNGYDATLNDFTSVDGDKWIEH